MSMNTLSVEHKDFSVSPSEQVIVISVSQLQNLLKEAVRETIQPLQAELSDLQAVVASQQAEMADLRTKIASLEAAQDTLADNQLIQLRLINELRESTKKEPQPLQKDRSEILRALLAANGGKMLAKDARQKMHLSRSRFSELLGTMKGMIDVRPSHLNKRQNILILL